jgi:hypothetical protein
LFRRIFISILGRKGRYRSSILIYLRFYRVRRIKRTSSNKILSNRLSLI